MSQFNGNFGNFGPGSYDPVSSLLPNSPMQGAQPQRQPRRAGQQVSMQQPQGTRTNRQWQPYTGGMTAQQPGNPYRSSNGPARQIGQSRIDQGFLNWDQALAGAMGQDMANQQGAMNQQFNQMSGQIGQYEDALQRGIGTMQSVGVQQRDALQGLAGGLEQQGQKGFDEFKAFRDQQMGRVDQDISKANQFAAQATQNYEQAIGEFKDTSAQDAANAAFGMRRNAQEQMSQIDMLDVDPGQKAALKQTMMQDVSNQVTQTVTGIYSNMNQTMASMRGNLSSLMGAQSQTAMAGGQLRGQMGTSFGAQTLQSQQMNQQMMELGTNVRMMGEQAYASAMQQSVVLELQGRTTVAQMIQENPRQFVSMFAGLTGYLAGATTPGINQISVPNFGAIA